MFGQLPVLYTVGKLFEMILLTRVLQEVNGHGLLLDEQFGFRPRHNMMLQSACIVERVYRNFDERWLSSMDQRCSSEANHVKLPVLPSENQIVIIDCETFQTSFLSAISTCGIQTLWPKVELSPHAVQSVCK